VTLPARGSGTLGRMSRARITSLVALALLAGATGTLAAPPVGAQVGCLQRILVLSAYPAEADAVLARTTLDAEPVFAAGDRTLYMGVISGVPVLAGMTGIGLVNAADTAAHAVAAATCGAAGFSLRAVLFAGVAGGAGRTRIADVAIPATWTLDDGVTTRPVDTALLAVGAAVAPIVGPTLERVNSAGDPACACIDPATVPIVDLGYQPDVDVGGAGMSSDGNGGEAMACIPGGGDTFGCQPCTAPNRAPADPAAVPEALFGLLRGGTSPASTNVYDAVDQETAAVQVVADGAGLPFLGIRGMSDGPGDPLMLPGFPFQFFVYKQLAADNAARVLEAVLGALPPATPTEPSAAAASTTAVPPPAAAATGSTESSTLPDTGPAPIAVPPIVAAAALLLALAGRNLARSRVDRVGSSRPPAPIGHVPGDGQPQVAALRAYVLE
jgi:nucleoside phosphorylase